MRTLISTAATLAAVVALASLGAQAKPVKMCIATGNGKNFLAIDNKGKVHAKADKCAGDAVFENDDVGGKSNVPPRALEPVVIRAANGKFVQAAGKDLLAKATKLDPKNQAFRFKFLSSHGDVKRGKSLAPKMRLHLAPVKGGMKLITAAPKGGGGGVINRKSPAAKQRRNPSFVFALTDPKAGGGDPEKVGTLTKNIATTKRRLDVAQKQLAIFRNQVTADQAKLTALGKQIETEEKNRTRAQEAATAYSRQIADVKVLIKKAQADVAEYKRELPKASSKEAAKLKGYIGSLEAALRRYAQDIARYERLNSRFVGIVVESLSIRFGSQRDGSRALSGLVLACR